MPTPNVLIATQPKQQFFLPGTGATPASGAKLFTYAAGTTTKQNTYTDSTGMVPSANPIILDSNGQCTYWLDETLMYKLTLAPSTDTDPPTSPYWTVDQLNGPNSAAYSTILAALAAANGATLVGGGIFVVSTLAALKAITNVTAPGVVLMLSYTALGDGGWGFFWWNASDITADNGGTVIIPNAGGTGRWNRLS